MSHEHFTLVVGLLFIGGIALMGLALSGYGSSDRTRQRSPRLPGHDVQDKLDNRE
ncbi:hypothetical protein [Aeromicrobium sp. Root236]|uniref:hypothetical protein n=1 Tax=Aeromicrobium sp. Root236 TaxID=1736498 RepID=UPI000AE9DB01|nr:hypothetical protein [Aeromicrobium sp. Root236]